MEKDTKVELFRGSSLSASLTVKDIHKSLAWYHSVLNFAVDQKYERDGNLFAVSLKAGEVRILITQDNGVKGFDRSKGEGFSLRITTDQNIDDIANRIKKLGGILDSEPADTPWGVRMFRLHDPDGFKFTISSMKAT